MTNKSRNLLIGGVVGLVVIIAAVVLAMTFAQRQQRESDGTAAAHTFETVLATIKKGDFAFTDNISRGSNRNLHGKPFATDVETGKPLSGEAQKVLAQYAAAMKYDVQPGAVLSQNSDGTAMAVVSVKMETLDTLKLKLNASNAGAAAISSRQVTTLAEANEIAKTYITEQLDKHTAPMSSSTKKFQMMRDADGNWTLPIEFSTSLQLLGVALTEEALTGSGSLYSN